MTNTTKMELLTQENFGEMEVSFYKDENNDVFMTRNQIGTALGYGDPHRAMSKDNEDDNMFKTMLMMQMMQQNQNPENK